MNHQLINTGAGWTCLRCKVAWDQGEDTTGDCAAGDEYQFVADDLAFKTFDLSHLPPDPDDRFPDLAVKREPTFSHTATVVCATGDAEFLKDDAGGRRFFPLGDPFPEDGEWKKRDVMTAQVAGTHYSKLAIQPTEFCQRNGLDFCIGSILKYLTRYRNKNGRQDLEKARHFVEIREAFPYDRHPPRHVVVPMLTYINRNGIAGPDAEALYRLEAYYNARGPESAAIGAGRLISEIDSLIAQAG